MLMRFLLGFVLLCGVAWGEDVPEVVLQFGHDGGSVITALATSPQGE